MIEALKFIADKFGLTCWHHKRHVDVKCYDRYGEAITLCVRCGRERHWF